MQSLTSIVAVNQDGVIGCGNALPWRLKTDMRFFKEQTIGNVVLMGRKTYDSLGKRCLPHRYNVIVSHHFGLFPETDDCKSATGIDDALFRASLAPQTYKKAFVIGGASMYEQFGQYVDRYLITLVDKRVTDGDTYFDQNFLGDPDQWNIKQLDSVPAGTADEAAFSIFEVTSRYPEMFLDRRLAAIANAKRVATANTQSKLRRTANRGSSLHPNYSML
ncbi:dihydrofolate reductase [Allosphingosinicella humi]